MYHQVQVDGMDSTNHQPIGPDGMDAKRPGLSASGCMQPDAVKSNHADMFTPALTVSRINDYGTTVVMMTKAELDILTREASHAQKLAHCVILFEQRYSRLWIHSYTNVDMAIKNAIECKAWGLKYMHFTKPV